MHSKLIGKLVKLRALEPEDIDVLYAIENNELYWEISGTQTPYAKHVLQQYIANSHLDIYEAKQLRFVIENNTSDIVGLVDLFDFNPQHLRCGVGILIVPEFSRNGYAFETLSLLKTYAFTQLNLQQLYANVGVDNTKSLRLFEKLGYTQIGVRKNWILSNNEFKDVAFFQLLANS